MKKQDTTGISLSELLDKVKQVLDSNLSGGYWVSAEINEIKTNTTGHCYLTLIEKDEYSEALKAKINATIWASVFRLIKPYFESSTGRPLSAGLKVLIKASTQYHPLYGLSLNITDIEPAFTVGSMAMQRRNTIAQLENDGVFEMNQVLDFPVLPQRIAVISSEQAAGYEDFIHQLHDNEYGYDFRATLFPVMVQGNTAAEEMVGALDTISKHLEAFDVVVIIRGGGAVADLACFDDYTLASNVAQFPLPILTGIGHNKDESVVDMVAHLSLKTPTAVADHLISCLVSEDVELDDYANTLSEIVATVLSKETVALTAIQDQIQIYSKQLLQQEHFSLQLFAENLNSYNPYNILARGYAVVRQGGKAILDPADVKLNGGLEVMLYKGKLRFKNYELRHDVKE